MLVILLTDVVGLGQEGETHEVSDGYARNFLFPKHLAVPATPETVRDVAARAAAARREAEQELHALQRLAGALDGQEFTITAPANASGTLYGGMSADAITALLTARGFRVRVEWVALDLPVKEVGEHRIRLQLPHGLEAEITVLVEAEQ